MAVVTKNANATAGIPYPDRFHAAAAYVGVGIPDRSAAASKLTDETNLLLYALFQQATIGPCNTPKPWSWSVLEQAKWASWNELGDMSSIEAMRLFVRTLEEEDSDWYMKQIGGSSNKLVEENPMVHENGISMEPETPPPLSSNGGVEVEEILVKVEEGNIVCNALEVVPVRNEWVSPVVSGRRPSARYQHAAAVVQDKMFVVGGNHNGRYLSDVQVLDLRTLTWSKVEQKMQMSSPQTHAPSNQILSPCAGHSLIRWGRMLLAVAGHSKNKSETVTVHAFDTETFTWSLLPAYGQAPVARGGQTVSLVGSNLVMFGGEDSKRRLLNDLNIFDLETMTWDAVDAIGAPPSPRSDHAAAVYNGRYLCVFGGGSHSSCFNDLHILDMNSMEWSQPESSGVSPSPRAGLASVAVDDKWYLVGGGDNKAGISETMVLNMSTLEWSVLTTVPARTYIACEGASVVSAPINGEETLISFGGYNGRYSNEVHTLKTGIKEKKKLKLLQPNDTLMTSTSIPDSGSYQLTSSRAVDNPLPDTQSDADRSRILDKTIDNSNVDGANKTAIKYPATEEKLAAILEANKGLKEALGVAEGEAVKLKQELSVALSTSADLAEELQSVRGQLVAEQSRCFRLEVDVAELRQKLQSMETLQKELDLLRRQKAASEAAAEVAAQKQNKGVWGWLTGNPGDMKPSED